MGTVAFKPQESSIKELLTFSTPFYRWDEWSSGNPTQLLRDRAGSSLGLSPQAVLLVLASLQTLAGMGMRLRATSPFQGTY